MFGDDHPKHGSVHCFYKLISITCALLLVLLLCVVAGHCQITLRPLLGVTTPPYALVSRIQSAVFLSSFTKGGVCFM